MFANAVLAIQFTNTENGTSIIVGPFAHASIEADVVRATRAGGPDATEDEIVAVCDGHAWLHETLPYHELIIVPWLDGRKLETRAAASAFYS